MMGGRLQRDSQYCLPNGRAEVRWLRCRLLVLQLLARLSLSKKRADTNGSSMFDSCPARGIDPWRNDLRNNCWIELCPCQRLGRTSLDDVYLHVA